MTISASTYAILYSHPLYERLAPRLGIFERSMDHYAGEDGTDGDERIDVIVCGAGRFGGRLTEALEQRGHRVLVVDLDPRAVEARRIRGLPAQYGDIEDPELPAALPLSEARWVISSITRLDANLTLLHALQHHDFPGRTAITTHHEQDIERLRTRGTDAVLSPFDLAVHDTLTILHSADPEWDGEPPARASDLAG